MRFRPLLLLASFAAWLSACNDGSVTFVPHPPIAVIHGSKTWAPLDLALFDGSASHAQDGTIVAWQWEIVVRPSGSTTQPQTNASDPSKVGFVVDIAGDYAIQLTVTDSSGEKGSAVYPFVAVPWQTIHIELTWDTAGTDLDLHLVSDTDAGTFFQKPFDCFFENTNPDWGQPGVLSDDPSIDRDDVDGYGPEVVSLEQPTDGHTYHVYVHYFDDHGVGSTTADLRVFLNGSLAFEGIEALAGKGDGWGVVTIDWPDGKVTPDGATFHYLPGP